MKKTATFFKQSTPIFIFILVMMNVGYVSVEIYKSKFSETLIGSSHITQAEFSGLETLSNVARGFEAAFILASIGWILWIFLKKNIQNKGKPLLYQALLLMILFAFNYALSWFFEAPVGNLIQLLIGPIIYVAVALIVYAFKELFQKRRRSADASHN